MENERKFDKVVALAKARGFVFPSSEIYGGLGSINDYGPLGVELKNNIKKAWWDFMLSHRNIVGLDSGILMHPKIWEASGHVAGFSDPLVDCKKCKSRFRADHLLESLGIKPDFSPGSKIDMKKLACPECKGELTDVRQFNLMFKTFIGPVENQANQVYLRPETAQGIYVNFLNVKESMRLKGPFGIAQIGKAFRNEITPGNFIFRMREFEQMEIEYFTRPTDWEASFNQWLEAMRLWIKDLGIDYVQEIEEINVPDGERAHYSKKTIDFEYKFPFGQKELYGLAYRTDFDLKNHGLEYVDDEGH